MKIRRRKFQSNHAFGHMLAFVKINKTCYAKSTPYFLSLTLVIPRNPLIILFKATVNEFSTLYGVVKPDVSQKVCGSNIFHISIFVCTFCIIYTECALFESSAGRNGRELWVLRHDLRFEHLLF